MRLYRKIKYDHKLDLLSAMMYALEGFGNVALLNSNKGALSGETDFDYLIGIGATDILSINSSAGDSFEQLRDFHYKNKDWIFGHLSYDLKNEIEALTSENADNIGFPVMTFFAPLIMLKIKKNLISIYLSERQEQLAKDEAEDMIITIEKKLNTSISIEYTQLKISVHQRMSYDEYEQKINKILNHIQYGDIYELNFCQEFYAKEVELNPYHFYSKLNKISPSPFSVFYRIGDKYLISSSPERFLKKTGQRVISQPIKGTSPRYFDEEKDENSKKMLAANPKERAENMMIVDLVRNDLSRTAKPQSVKVEELCGIYSFPQVHQMISTVSSELREDMDFIHLLKTTFPMGSMTGAPKIKAMELIEKYETTQRGIYSGAVGYITPEGNFDFNVIIRSLVYNKENDYISFITGGAITSQSTALQEYEECMLKAKGIIEALG